MGIRLVAADLDGTLLNPEGTISARTREVLGAISERGMTIALVTSRRMFGAIPVARTAGVSGPLIVYDGGAEFDGSNETLVESRPMKLTVAREVISRLRTSGMMPVVQYVTAAEEYLEVEPFSTDGHAAQGYLRAVAPQVRMVAPHALGNGTSAPVRIVAFGHLTDLRRVARGLTGLQCHTQVLPQGNYGVAELSVFDRHVSKGSAVKALAGRLGISMADVFAIGDGINDVSLFAVAGLSVAMANATPELLAVANEVTLSNAQDGAAVAMERHVLGRSLA